MLAEPRDRACRHPGIASEAVERARYLRTQYQVLKGRALAAVVRDNGLRASRSWADVHRPGTD